MTDTNRYSRQVRFTSLGEAGQQRLGLGKTVVIGSGALGCVALELLARAGVGALTVIDRDYVELNNLQRQLLFDEADAAEGLPKAIAAQRRLQRINSEVKINAIVDDLRPRNAADLLHNADVIIDATDNFEARFLINDYAIKNEVPWIYGAAVGSYGITMPVLPGRNTACLRCLYPDISKGAQPTCDTAGVLGTVTTLIASLQANVAIQILSGNRDAVRSKITTVDLWTGPLREIDQPERDPTCACCGEQNFAWLEGERDSPVSLCGRNAVQIHGQRGHVNLAELRTRLLPLGEVRSNDFALRFLQQPHEITVFADGRAIIKGTTDIAVARSLYARWIGA